MRWRIADCQIKGLLAVILLGVAVLAPGRVGSQTREPTPSNEHPLWQADMRNFGYEWWPNPTALLSPHQGYWVNRLDFTDNDHLAWAWLTLDTPPSSHIPSCRGASKGCGNKEPDPRQPKPAHLHVLFLDARSGQKQAQQEWPTPSRPVQLLGLRDGKFLACTGESLRIFSSGFEVLWQKDSLSAHACKGWPRSRYGISPSRRSLLLSDMYEGGYRTEILNLDTFAVDASWIEQNPMTVRDVADHWLLGNCGEPPQTCIRGVGEAWRPFQPIGLDSQMIELKQRRNVGDPKHATTVFLNDRTLLIEAPFGNEMAVATTDGSVLFQVKLPKDRVFNPTATAYGGERFAVMEDRFRGLRSEPLDMYPFPSNDQVVVYSIPDRRAIFAMKVIGTSPWTPWKFQENQVALSPDGTLLAIECGGVVKVYRLP